MSVSLTPVGWKDMSHMNGSCLFVYVESCNLFCHNLGSGTKVLFRILICCWFLSLSLIRFDPLSRICQVLWHFHFCIIRQEICRKGVWKGYCLNRMWIYISLKCRCISYPAPANSKAAAGTDSCHWKNATGLLGWVQTVWTWGWPHVAGLFPAG